MLSLSGGKQTSMLYPVLIQTNKCLYFVHTPFPMLLKQTARCSNVDNTQAQWQVTETKLLLAGGQSNSSTTVAGCHKPHDMAPNPHARRKHVADCQLSQNCYLIRGCIADHVLAEGCQNSPGSLLPCTHVLLHWDLIKSIVLRQYHKQGFNACDAFCELCCP